ncbi:hypothetical protein K440DRAFT_638885 [Wilcoxina mikolae CBS 423.85]|nr:hypothetical protein K440DRAFT_638885 [Wilcoxina mikolae CBS 423.85]
MVEGSQAVGRDVVAAARRSGHSLRGGGGGHATDGACFGGLETGNAGRTWSVDGNSRAELAATVTAEIRWRGGGVDSECWWSWYWWWSGRDGGDGGDGVAVVGDGRKRRVLGHY